MRQVNLLILLILISSIGHSQSRKVFQDQTITYSALEKLINLSKWDTLIFERITFQGDLGKKKWEDSVYGEFIVSNPINAVKINMIEFIECEFSTSIFFEGKFEGDVSLTNCKGPEELIFQNCDIRGLSVYKPTFASIHVEHSNFKDLNIDVGDETSTIILYRVVVDSGFVEIIGSKIHVEKSTFALLEKSLIENEGEGNVWTAVHNSRFVQLDSGYLQFNQTNGYIRIYNSTFLGNVDFYGNGDKITWDLFDNTFKQEVGFRTLAEIGPASYINFKEIYTNKSLGWHIEKDGKTMFYDGSGNQIAEERYYINLLRLHKRLHNFYIDGGDIYSANLLYTRIKDLETRHLISEFENLPSFDTWIRIWLNKVLKFYTRYSTDPSRAITISLWVIFGFGIFYIFFPSSWDLSSKSKLIADFKNLKEVEAGRFKKILGISINVTIILLNAFTLSLNSFVTLGFGEIPTKGFARYMTIGEGFLGWFLLTLFSVALISQSNF